MEEIKIKKQISSKDLKKGLHKIDDPFIHTMPKRFINVKEATQESHKGVGLLIFGLGAIFMVAAIVFIYFFVFSPANKPVPVVVAPLADETVDEENDNQKIAKETTEPILETKEENDEEDEQEEEIKIEEEITKEELNEITEIEDEANTTKKIIAVIPKEEKKVFLPAPDADQDGLNDAEEVIFGTDIRKVDTDQDGYADLSELKNLFNPAGDGKLIVNSGIEKFSNTQKSYSLYYPKFWEATSMGQGETVIFKIDEEQFIQVITSELSDNQSLEDWYKEQFKVSVVGSDKIVYKKSWNGIKNEDGLIYYLAKPSGQLIFTVNYNANSSVLYYENIFEMMINSLEME